MIGHTYVTYSRLEECLKQTILKNGTKNLPVPQSRIEKLLWELCELISNESEEPIPGPIGPAGPQGNPGKSAYQIALDNGFEGTESEWLASLKGEPGTTPIRGRDYWTSNDISEIQSYVDQKIAENIKPTA